LRAMPDSLLPKDLVDPAVLDAVLCIEAYLRPSLRGPGSAMEQAGAPIREAFEPAFAERMHHSLDACTTWQVFEKYEEHVHYHHHNLYQENGYPPDLAWCDKVFSSAATKAWGLLNCAPRTAVSTASERKPRFLASIDSCASTGELIELLLAT
jgi:hypothetical protein